MLVTHILTRAAACVAAVAFVAACKGKENKPAAERSVAGGDVGTAANPKPGGGIHMRTFHGNKQQAIAGRELFLRYNCYGCHGGLAGGGMGPSLRDDEWKYGGTDSAIYASIRDGRPAGMPKWKGTIPDTGLRDLVVYIKSMRTNAEPTFFFSPTDTTTHAATAEQ
jgi:cytochrome c oxidase cbb3-type subunit 3